VYTADLAALSVLGYVSHMLEACEKAACPTNSY
jgi:hypothetical protein